MADRAESDQHRDKLNQPSDLNTSFGDDTLASTLADLGQDLKLPDLKREFREVFKWADFVAEYHSFLKRHRAVIPKGTSKQLRKEISEDTVEDSISYEELEFKFADRVIEAFFRWNAEDSPIVLWDVDNTMGASGDIFGRKFVSTTGFEWGFRPCFVPLLRFLNEKFPDVTNGILSTRPKDHLESQLTQANHLGAIETLIARDRIYSSDGDDEAKLQMLSDFRASGLNVKSIDDNRHVSRKEADQGTGISFTDCPVFEELCICLPTN